MRKNNHGTINKRGKCFEVKACHDTKIVKIKIESVC